MRSAFLRSTFIISVFLILTASIVTITAQQPARDRGMVMAASGIVLRSGAGARFQNLAALPSGTILEILEVGAAEETIGGMKGHWLKTKFNGREGWVFGGWIAYPLVQEKIEVSQLTGQRWTPGTIMGWGWVPLFESGGNFTDNLEAEGGGECSGRYTITNGLLSIALTGGECSGAMAAYAQWSCALVANSENFLFFNDLRCYANAATGRKAEYRTASVVAASDSNSAIPPGTRRYIEGIMGMTVSGSGKTTTNVFLRNKPSASAPSQDYCRPDPKSGQMDTTHFIPAGIDIRVYGRTLQQETIQGKTSYWYYASVNYECGMGMPIVGWVFGAYISPLPPQ